MGTVLSFRATRPTKTQKTIDLPATGGTPAEIEANPTGGTLYAGVSVFISSAFYWPWGENAKDGNTRLGNDDTRRLMPSGSYMIDIAATSGINLYIKSDAAAVTDGISYEYLEALDVAPVGL